MSDITISTLGGIPLIAADDDLAAIILKAAAADGLEFTDGDVLVVAQKIISKAEGRLTRLSDVEPGKAALALADETEKDPRLVQLILDESATVLRHKPGVIIVRHKLGHVGANAGIDQSNIAHDEGDAALLLPRDPDASAARLFDTLKEMTGKHVGVIIADSMNRPWRMGTVGGAIGCAGVQVLDDLRGAKDMFGRELKVAMVNRADSIAAMASLVMGETTERTPVALVRGLPVAAEGGSARDIMRPLEDDLFK
ncbi:MAG: coenzyme F420-0:L-glutamate ligase [Gammaproteobacteria bacterium]|nr:coenzyme F420-0:L-glutamate ligase [Gammaproteobacteria bacterium]